MREGEGNCLKYLKRGWNRTEGTGHKDFKKRRGKLYQAVGALKKGGGGWNHLNELCEGYIECKNLQMVWCRHVGLVLK